MLDLPAQADDQKLLALVIDYYHRTLKETTEGLDYLRGRGITSGEAIDHFRIGYANRTLGLKLPHMRLKTGKEIRTRLQEIGIYRGTGHEHFNGCVVFPITAADGTGRIVDLYGRKTGPCLRPGTPLHMYLSNERHGVWNVGAFGASQEIILCPSLFDALTFWNAGYRNVSCTFGPEAVTPDHLAAFREFGLRRVLVAAESIVPRLLDAGLEVYLLALPKGLDANQYALQSGDLGEALGEVIRKAVWQGKGASPALPVVEVPQVAPANTDRMDNGKLADDDVEGEPDGIGVELDDLDDAEVLYDEDDDDDDLRADDAPEPAPVLSASPLPPIPHDVAAEVQGDEVTIQLGHRRYRVRGLTKNLAFDQMKVNLLATTEKGMFVDTFDIYVARHRRQFIAQASVELDVEEETVKKDLGRVLLKLEELQDEQITAELTPKEATPPMTAEERDAAMALLRDPRLMDRVVQDFHVVGETTNKLLGYLAAVSRKLDQPLAILVQSSSAAGKSSLMDAILAFVPPEDQIKYSAMTGQSLFYMGETNLQHKILAIAEEEGAERASYALKLLQSEGTLAIASTGKDPGTGRLVAQEYRVQGPVMLFLTTTAIKIDEELLNRCLLLAVDEDREQTRAIHQFQRRSQTLAGLLAEHDRHATIALHRNAQRLLRPLLVANPYAESLTFLDDKTRTRRDHLKYLTLIRAIALLHQYQRPVKTIVHHDEVVEYIEATLDDIAVANKLACEVLGKSADDLSPQTRRLLTLIDEMVVNACERLGIDRAEYRFCRRDIREFTGWGHTQLKTHLKRLEELEYLMVHRGGRGQSFAYELLYQPSPNPHGRFLARLIDVEQLRRQYDHDWSGQEEQKSGGGRGQVGPKSGRSRASKIDASATRATTSPPSGKKVSENAHWNGKTSLCRSGRT